MKNFVVNFFTGLLDWLFDSIYKKKCYFCGRSHECVKMCSNCYDEMDYLPIESNRLILDADVYCAGAYESNLQKLIRGLKYHNQKDLAYFQAKFMYDYWTKLDKLEDFYQVVPIPLYKEREKKRKYNHMALVAEEFCKLCGYELNIGLVERIKDTKPQYKLNKQQRMENLSNAFRINKNALLKGKVLLIDDICTTGSTFESIILDLKKNLIDDIVCFATTTPFTEGTI